MPQPKPEHAEAAMHMARTGADTIAFKHRAYSHNWLKERGLPSQLPDWLKPSADRLYPTVVEGVGISVNSRNPFLQPAMLEVQGAMENVVADMYANGDTDPVKVKKRMLEARESVMSSLFGNLGKRGPNVTL